jgi:putative transposase
VSWRAPSFGAIFLLSAARGRHDSTEFRGRRSHAVGRGSEGLRVFRSTPSVSLAAQSGPRARRTCREEEAILRRANYVGAATGGRGIAVGEVCRQVGISEQTFYRWKKDYGGMLPSEARELKQLRDENAKLKRLVADLSLDKAMLQDVVQRKF